MLGKKINLLENEQLREQLMEISAQDGIWIGDIDTFNMYKKEYIT